MKKAFRIDKLSEAEKSKIFEKDKNQYLAWLYGTEDNDPNDKARRSTR